MLVRLCKKSLERQGEPGRTLEDALREREHSVVIKDCLDRCGACEKGVVVASADGMPLGVPNCDALLAAVDELAAAES